MMSARVAERFGAAAERRLMIYVIAIILSLIVCVQCFASEITAGNIRHVNHGRTPNASAALFPLVPIAQLLAAGGAWLLQTFVPRFAIWIVVGSFLVITIAWMRSFARLRSEFRKVTAARGSSDQARS